MNYYVAKSYQTWPIETEPYEVNGRMYVKVRQPNGNLKQVRAYNDTEYKRLYPDGAKPSAIPVEEAPKTQDPIVKNILGFQDGYIWIFKGDLDSAEYWFKRTKECRYHRLIGWYIVSTDTIPFDIPSCIESIKLPWEKVGNSNGTLLPKSIVEAAVNSLKFDNVPSQFQGKIGDRMELNLYLTQIIELEATQYGPRQIYCFEDADANHYSWNTGTKKNWSIGDAIHCRAGIKAHNTIKGIRTTELTRLMEVKK